jgi:hypothetical protein
LSEKVGERFSEVFESIGDWKEKGVYQSFLLQDYQFQSWAYLVGLNTILNMRRPLHNRLNTDVAKDVCTLLREILSTMKSIEPNSPRPSTKSLHSMIQTLQDLFLRLAVLFPADYGPILKHIVACRIIQPEDSFRELGASPALQTIPDVETMAAMKRINLLIQQSDARRLSNDRLIIDLPKELVLDKTKSMRASSGIYTRRESGAHKVASQVLVEWKGYEGLWDTEVGNYLFHRVELLTELLRTASRGPNRLSLRILECLGYCHDETKQHRIGFVFQIPASVPDRKMYVRLKTLLHAYGDQGLYPPSVNDRIRIGRLLCRAMFQFHNSDWFHKGFTSSNIILFSELEDTGTRDSTESLNVKDYSILAPYIIGYNYSRPSKPNEFSEPSNISEESRRYQHPDYKNVPMQKYRHEYDYYSLGIVLLEIGQWTPLTRIMDGKIGFDKVSAFEFAKEVKELSRLQLSSFVPEMYQQVVLNLLEAFEEERISLEQNELIEPGRLIQFQTDILESLTSFNLMSE